MNPLNEEAIAGQALEMAFEAKGQNPHYRPPIMRWNQVEIIADEGTQFGIEYDGDGLLCIVIRGPRRDWPHNRKPPPDGRNTILSGEVSYLVKNDDRGPAVGHEFQRSSVNPEECVICNETANPVTRSTLP